MSEPSEHSENLEDPLFKGILCKFFDQGYCRNGETCPYAHGKEQLPAYKTVTCRYIETKGFCRNGDNCTFAHDPKELRQAPTTRQPMVGPGTEVSHSSNLTSGISNIDECPPGSFERLIFGKRVHGVISYIHKSAWALAIVSKFEQNDELKSSPGTDMIKAFLSWSDLSSKLTGSLSMGVRVTFQVIRAERRGSKYVHQGKTIEPDDSLPPVSPTRLARGGDILSPAKTGPAMNEPMTMQTFLNSLKLSKYLPEFEENEIDFEVLSMMSDSDLARLGIPVGPRFKILRALEAFIQENFLCPLTGDIMRDPVVAADGFTYEHTAIINWMRSNVLSPMSGEQFSTRVLVPNFALRGMIEDWRMRSESSTTQEIAHAIGAPSVQVQNMPPVAPAGTHLQSPTLASTADLGIWYSNGSMSAFGPPPIGHYQGGGRNIQAPLPNVSHEKPNAPETQVDSDSNLQLAIEESFLPSGLFGGLEVSSPYDPSPRRSCSYASCATKSDDQIELKQCGRCFSAWYCGIECQQKDWQAGHRNVCGRGNTPSTALLPGPRPRK